MENKKSFVLYCDLMHTVKRLPDDVAGQLFKHVLSYVNDENPVTDNLLIEVCFEPIKQQLKRDLCKWQERKDKRVEAGKKGGLAKASNASNAKKPLANLAVNGNVNVNGNVSVSVIDEIKDTALRAAFVEFIKHRKQLRKPMTPIAITRMIKKLNKQDPATAEAMLIQSMENGWSGIFELKEKHNGKSRAEQAIQNINEGGNEDLNQIEGLGSF